MLSIMVVGSDSFRRFMNANRKPIRRPRRALLITVALGAASLGLYSLLYLFSDVLAQLALATRDHKLYAVVPVAVAMVFSFVHGSFTGYFWDTLGLRAKK